MTERTMDDVGRAIVAAYRKHGELTRDTVRACAILGREWGEAMDEALLLTRPGYQFNAAIQQRLYDELAQVAATAVLMMEAIIGE